MVGPLKKTFFAASCIKDVNFHKFKSNTNKGGGFEKIEFFPLKCARKLQVFKNQSDYTVSKYQLYWLLSGYFFLEGQIWIQVNHF